MLTSSPQVNLSDKLKDFCIMYKKAWNLVDVQNIFIELEIRSAIFT